jgi:hypothetical protein
MRIFAPKVNRPYGTKNFGSLGSQGGDMRRSHLQCDKLTALLSLYKSDLREKISSCQPPVFLKNQNFMPDLPRFCSS